MNARTPVAYLLFTALALTPAVAGVVFEIEVTHHEQSPPGQEPIEMSVAGRNIRMNIAARDRGDQGEMIYRGDRREMIVVDHDDQSYMVVDETTIQATVGQINDAMAQAQKALENVPAEQRKMVERMMRERIPPQAPELPESELPRSELRRTSERSHQSGYPCVKYEVLRNGRKTHDLWVTDWSRMEGGDEASEAFHGMASFFRQLMETIQQSLPSGGLGSLGEEPYLNHLEELGGFPVVTRQFDDNGSLTDESTVRSIRRRALEPSAFEPPAGYKRRSLGPS
jgi:hypothetical protein